MNFTDQESVYKNLEDQFVKYAQLKAIKLNEINESMQSLTESNISFSIYADEMTPSSGADIWVRASVIKRLKIAQDFLSETNGDLLH